MTNMLRVTAFPHLEMATKALVNSFSPRLSQTHKKIQKHISEVSQRHNPYTPNIRQTPPTLNYLVSQTLHKLRFDPSPITSPSATHIHNSFITHFQPFFLTYTQHLKKINANHPSFLGYGHVSHCVTNKTEKLHQILHTISSIFFLISHNPHANLYSCLNIYPITTLFTVFPRGNSEDIKTTLVIIPNST